MGFLDQGLIGMQYATIFRMFIVIAATAVAYSQGRKCNIVVYFGQKTADCQALGLTRLPRDMGYDLKVLQFKENKLTHLGIDFFKSYTAIQELFIERNEIHTVAPEAFRGLSNLQVLDLTRNDLSIVPISSFRYLTSLRELILKGNPIKYITENAFGNLPRIEVLNFENCWLERVDAKAFHGLTYVKEINIVNNELKTLGAYMEFSLPPNLRIFRLYRNPWRCDCHLRWLREWIEKTKVNWDFSQNTPACTTPDIMRGLNWKHLKPDQFACPSQILENGTTSLELEVGQNVTIDCLVTGDPRPVITWYKEGNHITVSSNLEKYTVVTSGHDPIHSIFSIWDVGLEDAGDYKCVAENSAGRSEVTNKLWIWEDMEMPRSQGVASISQESILGIAVGSVLFLLILVVCVVYGLRRRDKRKHAYRVRDYKKPNKNKKDKSYIKENCEKSAGATTELLSEKEKEKERGKAENQMTDAPMSNNVKENSEDFKMKIFAYRSDGTKPNQTQCDMSHTAPEQDEHETEPLCKGDTLKPRSNNMREVTPDLLKNDNTSKPHHTKKPNHVTVKESPNKGEHRPNGCIERQKDLMSNQEYGKNYSKEGNKDYNTEYSSQDERSRYRDNREHRGSPNMNQRKERDPMETRHPNSRRNSLEDIIAQNSSSSRDSVASTQKGSSRGSPCRSPDPDKLDNSSELPHYSSNTVSKSSDLWRERLSDGVKFATLPSKPSGARTMPVSPYSKSGTLRSVPRQGSAGHSSSLSSSSDRVHRPHSTAWGPSQTSPQSSPAIKQGSRTATAPVPIIKLPDGQLIGRKDYRTLVVPPPPLPPANRSPFAIKSPSGPAALVNPGEGLPPAPRKPPRTYSSVYENPYSTVSRQASRQSSQGSRQSSHDGEGEGIHRVGHQDEFGTCV